MKKFEEEVKRPASSITRDSIKPKLSSAIEFYTQKQKDAYNAIRERDEYIDFLESKLNESRDLECDANNQAAHEYILKCEAEKQIADLKPQLEKQQPEIPEFVAEVVENHDLETLANWANLVPLLSTQVRSWLLSSDLVGHSYTYLLADLKINGYTVAKEKWFYLKHIDFCKRDKDYDWYMIKHSDGPLNHLRVEKGTLPPTVDTYFTQQEIGSMETGSYEQIEVEE